MDAVISSDCIPLHELVWVLTDHGCRTMSEFQSVCSCAGYWRMPMKEQVRVERYTGISFSTIGMPFETCQKHLHDLSWSAVQSWLASRMSPVCTRIRWARKRSAVSPADGCLSIGISLLLLYWASPPHALDVTAALSLPTLWSTEIENWTSFLQPWSHKAFARPPNTRSTICIICHGDGIAQAAPIRSSTRTAECRVWSLSLQWAWDPSAKAASPVACLAAPHPMGHSPCSALAPMTTRTSPTAVALPRWMFQGPCISAMKRRIRVCENWVLMRRLTQGCPRYMKGHLWALQPAAFQWSSRRSRRPPQSASEAAGVCCSS